MKLDKWTLCVMAALSAVSLPASSAPTVYPTGITIYDPARTWNGYTVLSPLATQAVIVIDMNGNVVKRWDDFNNSAGGPARVLAGRRRRSPRAARGRRIRSRSSSCSATSTATSSGASITTSKSSCATAGTVWSSRQHHDWQREDFPAGYYSPEARPRSPAATR